MPDLKPRTWQERGFVPFRLEVLTPVHIGAGDLLSPLDYVIRKKDNSYWLCRIDLQGWLMQHGSDPSVQGIIASGDVGSIRNMLNEKVDTAVFALNATRIADAGLAQRLLQAYGITTGSSGQRNKTGNVAGMLRNPVSDCPCIPGSSLKGAISTPLINSLDQKRTAQGRESLRSCMEQDKRGSCTAVLTEMFGDIKSHAMQALKVSDCMTVNASCAIVRAVERSRKADKQGTPKDPCEAIMPGGASLWGRLMLDCSPKTPAITLPDGETITLSELAKLCNDFYLARFEREMSRFYQLPHFAETRKALQQIADRLQHLDSSRTMLLRAGHYSHVESVTVDNNKPSTRKGRDGKPMPWGTTRTLANGVWPFGWVLLHFCSHEDYHEGIASMEKALTREADSRAARLLEQRNQAEELARQALERKAQLARQREAAERKSREEEERKAELAHRMAELSPEEARLLQLQENKDEALSMQIYAEMQSWPAEMKSKAAEALRDCWSALGKWSGKQSKKQQEKIKLVKTLLES